MRLLSVWICSRFGKIKGPLEPYELGFRVWLNDLDVFGHMNNGRYQSVMDLGRMDLIYRSGLGKAADKNKWLPLVAAVNMTYKKSLNLGQGYRLITRIVAWDAKWFYVDQRFEIKGQLIARGLVKGLFRGPEGNVVPQVAVDSIQPGLTSPEIPDDFKAFLSSK